MKKLIFLLVLFMACDKKDPEPATKECDGVYTEIVSVKCCGMTGSGGLPPNSDCASYNYCIEYYICKKP